MGVDGIRVETRRSIFEAMVAMAWADTRLQREEILAVQAAGRVLRLPDDALDTLDGGPPELAPARLRALPSADRRLVYLCAAWLACVDAEEANDEVGLLGELRAALDLPELDAAGLRDDARLLHATTPASMAWWEELEALLSRAATYV